MSRFPTAPAVVVAAALAAGACTPTVAYNGFQARDEKPSSMKVGEDTKSTVLSKLGSPSSRSAFGDDTWFYISQISSKSSYHKAQIDKRDVVEIGFDKDEKVAAVKTYTLKDGFKIAYDTRATPTRGRQLNWVEQILGTVGRGGLLPQDNDPGNPRGGPGGGLGR